MKKKAYISPETEVVKIKIEQLMGTTYSVTSGDDGIHTPGDGSSDDSEEDNYSRRRRNVWDEEEEDW